MDTAEMERPSTGPTHASYQFLVCCRFSFRSKQTCLDNLRCVVLRSLLCHKTPRFARDLHAPQVPSKMLEKRHIRPHCSEFFLHLASDFFSKRRWAGALFEDYNPHDSALSNGFGGRDQPNQLVECRLIRLVSMIRRI